MTDSQQSEILMKALAGATALVVGLIGVIYNLLRSTDREQQTQLDDGSDEFVNHLVEIERIKKDLESIRQWAIVLEKDLQDLTDRQTTDHEGLLLIKDHHKRNHGEEVK